MITENTLRTKIEVAADGQLKATLEGVAQGVEKVDQAQQAQADSATTAAAAAEANATATQAVGESAADATVRIRAMVQASLERQQAEQAQIASSMRGVDATKVGTQSINEQVAAHQRAIAAADAYRARSAAASKAAADTSGVDSQRVAMHKLLGEIDPTIVALDKLDKQQAKLAGFKKAGLLSDGDFQRFSEAIDGSRNRVTAAGEAMAHFGLNTSNTRRELGYLVKDMATGNYGRLSQTSLTLAANTGVMGYAFGLAGAAVLTATGFLAAFSVGAVEAYLNEQKLNQAVAQTGNFAGVTMGQINGLANGLGIATGKVGLAREILLALSADGKVGAESFDALGQAAFDMAALTGKSAGEAARAVTQMFDGTAAGALKANEQYHFLTDATYDRIKALEDEGHAQEAAQVTADAFHDAVGPRIEEMRNQVYGLAQAWDSVAASTKGWWEEFKTGASLIAGTADITTQYYAQLGLVQSQIEHFGSPAFGQQEKLDDLKRQMDAAMARAEQQAAQTRMDSDATTASATLDRLSASVDKASAKKKALTELSAAFEKLWGSASPDNARLAGVMRIVNDDGSVSFAGGEYDTLRAALEKKYAPPKTPKGPHNPEPAAFAAFSNQVDALDIKNIVGDDSALTKYQQGIAKLAEDMTNYMAKNGDATKAAAEFNRGQQALQKTLDINRARELDAQAQYAAALDKSNLALQQQVNNEVARIGMGQKEYQRSQQLTKASQDEADALEKLALKRQAGERGESGGLSQQQYNADVEALRKATDRKVAIMQDGFDRMDAAQGDWTRGAIAGLRDYADAAADVAGQTRSAFVSAIGGIADNMASFFVTGRADWGNFVQDILQQIVKIQIAKGLAGIAGGIADGLSFSFLAKGGVYDSPSLSQYSGGVYDSPQLFKFASGAGVFGEDGPEAIMPLSRGSDGKLGVRAGGGMGGIEVVVNITNQGQAVQAQQTGARMDGRKLIIDMVLQAVQSDIARGGDTAKVMQQRFGLQRRGVPVGG